MSSSARSLPDWFKQPWFKQPWLIGAAIALIALLTIFTAPQAAHSSGSSFSRAPDGYGAWYAFMQKQGTPIQRWQRPFQDIKLHLQQTQSRTPVTLIQVTPIAGLEGVTQDEENWVRQGNRLVLLGVYAPVTSAPFFSTQSSPSGPVEIATRRRFSLDQANKQNAGDEKVLGDRFGAIAFRKTIGKGEVVYICTRYLAANAYQNALGNYQFLAQIVARGGNQVWIDEYIHGYKEADVITHEDGKSWQSYLIKTPLAAVLVQLLILFIILVWAENQRFGRSLSLSTPKQNNSRAYMQALAEVLQKAKSSEFIVEVVGREEQLHVQKALGLGSVLLDADVLLDAWLRQTGRSATELELVLQPYWQKRRLNDKDLQAWLNHIDRLRQHLPS
jgi:hypothetical protein